MSKPTKTGYRRTHDFAPYTRADGQAVSDELDAVQAHLDRLPELRDDGLGFKVSPVIPDPTENNHPVPFHLLKSAERSVYTAKDRVESLAQQVENNNNTTEQNTHSAIEANQQASQSQQLASEAATQAVEANKQAQQAKTQAQSQAQTATSASRSAQQSATQASESENLAQKWATNPVDEQVQEGSFSAYHYAQKAKASEQSASQSAQSATVANEQAQQAKTQAAQSEQVATNAANQATIAATTATEKADNLTALEQTVTALHVQTQQDANRAESAREGIFSAQQAVQQSAEQAQAAANKAKNIAGGRKEWSDIDNVPISSEVDNSSTTDLANSFAVKIAYDKAVEAKTSADNAQQSANNAQTAANNANNNANGRVSKSGDTMTGLLTIDMPASYILGKDGSKNKWWFGRGDADSDDITLMANAVRNKLTLKADRTESEKPLFVKQHQVYHPGHFPRAAENNYGFVKISHKTNGTDKTKAASEYALGQLASNLNQNQGFTQNLREVGWTKLPNGLILQWSSLTYIYSGQRINFPISFTNQCFFVAITPFGDDHSISATIALEGVRNGYFFAKSRAAGISYFAVGY